MIALEEAKNYLRVDYNEDDALILSLLDTAMQLCMDVGRMDEIAFAQQEESCRTAILYATAYLYQNRENADHHALTLSLRSLLFSQREGVL